MRKFYPVIALLVLTATVNGQRRLIKSTTPSGNWTAASTWTTTGSPATPTNNDSIVIATGSTVTITTGASGNSINLQDAILDILGNLVINEPSGNNKINNLNIITTTSNIAVPVIRLGDGASISKGISGNGTGQINVLVNNVNLQLKYSTGTVSDVQTGQIAGPAVTGPAFAQNTFNQQPMYFTLGSNASLPVSISIFKADIKDNNVSLSWTIQQEVNTKSFVIEKSTNGSSWQSIGSLPANGFSAISTNYQYTDAAASDVNYYRLKIVDLDGKLTYSNTLVIRLKNTAVNVSIFPNPAVNSVNLTIGNSLAHQGFTINLFNHNGQLVARRQVTEGTSVLSFDLSNYKTGSYTMDILFSGGTRETHKLNVIK